jgi:hypothetical protein
MIGHTAGRVNKYFVICISKLLELAVIIREKPAGMRIRYGKERISADFMILLYFLGGDMEKTSPQNFPRPVG